MNGKRVRGLFITGTDTGVGKTYVTALMAKALVTAGQRVGVYKPVASGCRDEAGTLVSDDAVALWDAAGRPDSLEHVCPQRFRAPLAPHLAAEAEGRKIDPQLIRDGLVYWTERSDIVLVEGIGGLMSPLSAEEYVADLAQEFGYPLIVVSRDALGTIHQTLTTLIAAATYGDGLEIAGVVLNRASEVADESVATNRAELTARCVPPVLAHVSWNAAMFSQFVDWYELAE